jgi:hypothetical protein
MRLREDSMEKSVGGLWIKKGKSGQFMSGEIDMNGIAEQTSEPTEKIRIVVFKNDRKKEGEKYPDYRIYLSKPKEDRQEPIPQETTDMEPF